MNNWKYTVFVSKKPSDPLAERLRVDTTDERKYRQAVEIAEKLGRTITRQYLPNDELKAPDFQNLLTLNQ